MADANRVSLTGDYAGALQLTKQTADQGNQAQALGKKMHAASEDFFGQNAGALASASHNGGTATANGITAHGNMHVTSADQGTRHIKNIATSEEANSHTQQQSSGQIDTSATDLQARVNRVSS